MKVRLYGGSKDQQVVIVGDIDADADIVYQSYDGTTQETWMQGPAQWQASLGSGALPGFLLKTSDANIAAPLISFIHLRTLIHTPPGTVQKWNETVACVDQVIDANIDLAGGARGVGWIEFILTGAPINTTVWHGVGDRRINNNGCIFINVTKWSSLKTDGSGVGRRYHKFWTNFYFASQWVIPSAISAPRFSNPVEALTQS